MFYGRDYELDIIRRAIASRRPELGIVYGRRRVGKSTLLAQAGRGWKGDLCFEGLQQAPRKAQIDHFLSQLAEQTGTPRSAARNWREALEALSYHLSKGKHYVVFDEFPWMASGRSELVSLVKYYWDNVWRGNPGLTVVLCGSVASFMFRHVVHSQALHNRKTFEIKLDPLPAHEAKLFFQGYRSDFEVAKFLMTFGGVPKYLEQIDPTQSLSANLDRLCFQRNGFFVTEFETEIKEQFKVSRTYEQIVRALAERSCAREALAQRLKMKPGGGLSSYIDNLARADFVKVFVSQSVSGKAEKTRRVVLWDEWLRFYFRYVEPHRDVIELNTRPGLFDQLAGNSFDAYCGLAFERLCMRNLPAILNCLGVGLHQVLGYGPFFRQPPRKGREDRGTQIDILVRRKGHVITVVECKFRAQPTGVSVIPETEEKIKLLRVPRHCSVEKVLITGGEITSELERSGYFHQILGLEAIFSPP